MQRLMILRHAKAVPWHPGVEDFSRALSDVGTSHAGCIARWLSSRQELPDVVLCSPSLRTRETLAPLLSLEPELETRTRFVPPIYGASVGTLTTMLDHAFAENDRVLIVGHNPGFEVLGFEVLAPSARSGYSRLPTGTLLLIDFDPGWSDAAGRGRLVAQVRGKKLAKD